MASQPTNAEIQVEASGAMRSSGLKAERWDLISGSAIDALVHVRKMDLSSIDHADLIEFAINSIWDFLSGRDNSSTMIMWPTEGNWRNNILIRGWWALAEAIDQLVGAETAELKTEGALPYQALRRCAQACAEGVTKYGEENWHNGFRTKEVLNHALNHLIKYTNGFRDEDDLGHAMWNFMVALHNLRQREDLNDLLLGPGYQITDEIKVYHDKKKRERGVLPSKEDEQALRDIKKAIEDLPSKVVL